MNATTKKWLALGSLAGVVATWLPQVVGDERAPRAATVELGADGAPLGSGDGVIAGAQRSAELEGSDERIVAAVEEPGASDVGAPSDLGNELDRRVAAVQALVASSPVGDLDRLATAWSRSSSAPLAAPDAQLGEDSLPQRSVAAPVDEAAASLAAAEGVASSGPVPVARTPAQALEHFIAERPLDLIVYGEERRCASLGKDLVREGDVLDGGIVVEAIGARTVLLRLGTERRRAKLAPFVARAKPVEVSTAQPSAQPSAGAQSTTTAAPLIDARALVRAATEIGKELHGASNTTVDDHKAKEPKR